MNYGMMDPVVRQFKALEEADGRVRIRYHLTADPNDVAESEMSHREYMRWVSSAQTNGYTLERAETIRRPS